MRVSEHSRESAFWDWIDDGPTEEQIEAAEHYDLFGHAEQHWRE